MNKKMLMKVGALALPLLFAACGGVDDIFGDAGTAACPAGVTVYKIQNGAYNTTGVSNIQDTCNNPPLTAAELTSSRSIMNDTSTGTIKVTSTQSGLEIGQGPVRCNSGTLTFMDSEFDANCTFDASFTSNITVTADNTFTLQVTENISNFKSLQGKTCTRTACSTSFTVNMKM